MVRLRSVCSDGCGGDGARCAVGPYLAVPLAASATTLANQSWLVAAVLTHAVSVDMLGTKARRART